MSRAVITAVFVLAFALSLSGPRTASADASQLCRSVTTLALAPTDILFSPILTAGDIRVGLEDQDDHWFPIAIGLVPGYVLLNYVQIGGTVLRVVAGAMEFVPGLATLARDTSPDPLFTSQDEAEALYSENFGPCPVRIGVHYNTIPWG